MRSFLFTLHFCLVAGMGISTLEAQQMKTVFEGKESFNNVTKVDVQGRFCKVTLLPSENEAFVIQSKIEAMQDQAAYKIICTNENSTLTVTVQVPEDGYASHAGEITISMPPSVETIISNTSGYIELNNLRQANLTAATTAGKITARDSDGSISLQTKSGNIAANNINGTIKTSSSSGDQFINNLEGTITLDSPDGAITADNIKGTLNISTISGAQTLTNIEGDMIQRSSSGAVKISNSKVNITTQSMNGSVNLFDVTGILNITTTKGLIAGSQVKLTNSSNFTTTEGKIKIKLLNKKEELTFVLRSESAPVIAMGSSKMKKLNTGKGPIIITGTSRTGGQNYY